jgi:hypothetical protein
VTPARFVPAGGQIEWAGLLLVATASVVLAGGVEVRHLAPLELVLFVLAGLAALRRWPLGAPVFRVHPAARPHPMMVGNGRLFLSRVPASGPRCTRS